MLRVKPVLSEPLLPLPNPTEKSSLSPAFRVFTKAKGTPPLRILMLPLSTVVLEFNSTATSVVVLSRPKKRPCTRNVPSLGAVQRRTLFSPAAPGCNRNVLAGIVTFPDKTGALALLKASSGNVVPEAGDVRNHVGIPATCPVKVYAVKVPPRVGVEP